MKTNYTKPQTQKIALPGDNVMEVKVSFCRSDECSDCTTKSPDDNGALGKEALNGGIPSYSVWSAWDDPVDETASKDSI